MDISVVRPVADAFYGNEFNRAKTVAKENPWAKRAIELAGRNGRAVVLATNPLFPMVGQISRLHWVGLDETLFRLHHLLRDGEFLQAEPELLYRGL
jgi:hypothetical protein